MTISRSPNAYPRVVMMVPLLDLYLFLLPRSQKSPNQSRLNNLLPRFVISPEEEQPRPGPLVSPPPGVRYKRQSVVAVPEIVQPILGNVLNAIRVSGGIGLHVSGVL